jgi:hypothetical protein
MYTQYRVLMLPRVWLPSGATKDGHRACQSLTALGMLETMRREGHSGAHGRGVESGQMLVKLRIAAGAARQHRPQA